MFDLVAHKEALVGDVWESTGEGGGWFPCFTRSFNDWEMEEVKNFLHTIQPLEVIPTLADKLILKDSKAGSFSVKLMFELLNHSHSVPFHLKSIWNPLVPFEAVFFFFLFFAWKASRGKVLTLERLKRRERSLASRCCLHENEKTIEYLLVHCQQAHVSGGLFWQLLELVGCSPTRFARPSFLGKEPRWEKTQD